MSSEEVQIVLAKRVVSKFSILVPTGMLENPPQVTVVVVLYFPIWINQLLMGIFYQCPIQIISFGLTESKLKGLLRQKKED